MFLNKIIPYFLKTSKTAVKILILNSEYQFTNTGKPQLFKMNGQKRTAVRKKGGFLLFFKQEFNINDKATYG